MEIYNCNQRNPEIKPVNITPIREFNVQPPLCDRIDAYYESKRKEMENRDYNPSAKTNVEIHKNQQPSRYSPLGGRIITSQQNGG